MRIVRFSLDGADHYGIERDGRIIPATTRFQERYPSVQQLLVDDQVDGLADNVDETRRLDKDAVTLLPPLLAPGKILCVGANYAAHRDEMGHKPSPHPLIFVRFPESQVGHDSPIVKPTESEQLDYEGELAVIIGKVAHKIQPSDAMGCIAGYSCFNDLTVRDWQKHSTQFTAGKNFAGVGAMGPALVTPDEAKISAGTQLRTLVNGEELQSASLDQMIFGIEDLIVYLSTFTILRPGDVIATGTPAGVGAKRLPPRWLIPGDEVRVEIDGVGSLKNTVTA